MGKIGPFIYKYLDEERVAVARKHRRSVWGSRIIVAEKMHSITSYLGYHMKLRFAGKEYDATVWKAIPEAELKKVLSE